MRVALMMGWLGAVAEGIVLLLVIMSILGYELNVAALVESVGVVVISGLGILAALILTKLR